MLQEYTSEPEEEDSTEGTLYNTNTLSMSSD